MENVEQHSVDRQHRSTTDQPLEPLAVSPRKCAKMLDCGLTKVHEEMRDGSLEFFKDGRSTKITMRSIRARFERLLEAQRDAKPAKELTEAATRARQTRRAERKAAHEQRKRAAAEPGIRR